MGERSSCGDGISQGCSACRACGQGVVWGCSRLRRCRRVLALPDATAATMAGRFSKTVRRMFVRTSFATVVFASATCYAYRPRPSWETEYYKNMVRAVCNVELCQPALYGAHTHYAHASQRGRQPSMSGPERWLASVGQAIAVGSTSTPARGCSAVHEAARRCDASITRSPAAAVWAWVAQ